MQNISSMAVSQWCYVQGWYVPRDGRFEKKHRQRTPLNLLFALRSVESSRLLWEADVQVEMAETLTESPQRRRMFLQ